MSGPTAAELDRAKTSTETGILFSLERNGGFDGIADRINMYNHHLKNPDYLTEDIMRFRTVSTAGRAEICREVSGEIRARRGLRSSGGPGPGDAGAHRQGCGKRQARIGQCRRTLACQRRRKPGRLHRW